MDEKLKFFLELGVVAISFFVGLVSLFLGLRSIRFIRINIDALQRQNETALKQNETAIEQNKIAIKSERNERFKNAIEQLGSDKNAIVLGGIYTLHRIAKEDESYRENVFNILCAFVRDTTTTEEYKTKYKSKPSEPIQTILDILCVNKEDLKIYRVAESKLIIDFSGAYLRGANLSCAKLMTACLKKANFTGAYFGIADFTDAYSCFADFTDADFTSHFFGPDDVTGADFSYADFSDANFTCANLAGVNLHCVTFNNANFTCANLTSADFNGTELYTTTFRGAHSKKSCFGTFENRIKSQMDKPTDLTGIKGGYDPKNPPFTGTPILGSYTKEEADEIIRKYNEGTK